MASVEKSVKSFSDYDSLGIPKEFISFDNESNPVYVYKGARSNRYYEAEIDWDSYVKGVELNSRGNRYCHDEPNFTDCNSYLHSFVPVDNNGVPKHKFKHCHKATCYVCGFFASNKSARRIAMKLLRLKNIPLGSNPNNYWRRIKFCSINFYNPKTNEYYKTLKTFRNGKERDKHIDFNFIEGMDFNVWFELTFKNISRMLKELNWPGFTVILHVDRINEFTGKRVWSPHAHVFGLGYMPTDELFKSEYGCNYSSFNDVLFSEKRDMSSLIPRISYYLNHASSYNKVIKCKDGSTYNRLANIYRSYGILANCMTKTIEKEKIKTKMRNDFGSPFVAKDLKPFIKSKKPKYAKDEIKSLRDSCLTRSKVYNYKKKGIYEARLKRVYDFGFKLDPIWKSSNPKILINPLNDKDPEGAYFYLYDVEYIEVIKVKKPKSQGGGFYSIHRISSYELIDGLEPSFKAEKENYIEIYLDKNVVVNY